MTYSSKIVKKFIGFHVHCHTHFGSFQGVVIQCTKRHVILGISRPVAAPYAGHWATASYGGPYRPYPMGGMGPMGSGGFGPGSGLQFAIPIAAILGITALGMHWW